MIHVCALCLKLGHEAKDCKSFQLPERTYTRSELDAAKASLEATVAHLGQACSSLLKRAEAAEAEIKRLRDAVAEMVRYLKGHTVHDNGWIKELESLLNPPTGERP